MAISKQQPMRPAEIELLNRINSLPYIEYGSEENLEVIANNNTVITVNFESEKTKAPIVLITLQNTDDGTNINAYAALKDVSTTSFQVRIYNLDGTNNQKLKVNWLAMGE